MLGRERLKLEETLANEERSLVPRDPDVARTSKLADAHEQVKSALRIFEASSLVAEHPHALVVKRMLAAMKK
eukprot:5322797-Amphidinium_carterae.1